MTAIQIIGVDHIPEVQPGDDLVRLIATGLRESDRPLVDGDVVVVTHKIVSKAEGQLVDLTHDRAVGPGGSMGREVREGRAPDRGRAARGGPDRADGARHPDR